MWVAATIGSAPVPLDAPVVAPVGQALELPAASVPLSSLLLDVL